MKVAQVKNDPRVAFDRTDSIREVQALGRTAKEIAAEIREMLIKVKDGWLLFGEALNHGRSMFPSDAKFGSWVMGNLPKIEHKEWQAAMWGAAMCKGELGQLMNDNPHVRTLRGLHAKWKQPEPKPERRAATLDDLLAALE